MDRVRIVDEDKGLQLWDEGHDPVRIYSVVADNGKLELKPWNRTPEDTTFLSLFYDSPADMAAGFEGFPNVVTRLTGLMNLSRP
jgi:hypothetical protein